MTDRLFLLAIHNHQPVGNFESVFDRAFRDCYRPLLTELGRHPRFKFTLHFSGPLWEYMEAREKSCWDSVGEMVGRGQAELLGGGFYEPILAVIPEVDRQGQIELMRRFLQERFGVRPRGLWLAERVWEPGLALSLARAGIEYTMLDEEHFHYAGVDDIHTTYVTEDEGFSLRVFPIDKKLRYLVPFHPVEEAVSHLAGIHRQGGLAILGDDGEKFGLWPGTHRLVYEEGWLGHFLDALDREGISTRTMAECLEAFPPRDRVYIPPASYEEMMEWVLEPEAQAVLKKLKAGTPEPARRFLRGGFFRDFFRKYPESNTLHKRMLLASRGAQLHPGQAVRNHVYRAQGNDPYWHGIFGGLYLPHLRQAAYRQIIEAEKLMRLPRGWSQSDFDADGRPEAIFRSRSHGIFFKPSYGGSILCLDSARLGRNLADVLTRRKEAYHLEHQEGGGAGTSIHEMARPLPPGSDQLLRYDDHRRLSLLDRFFSPGATAEAAAENRLSDAGDFLAASYEFGFEDMRPSFPGRGRARALVLTRSGCLALDGASCPVTLRKIIWPREDGLAVVWEIENKSPRELRFLFGSEWNLSAFPGEWEIDRETVWLYGRTARLAAPGADAVWSYPLQTLSQSETGYDIIHQGVCFLPVWGLALPAGSTASTELLFQEKR